MTLKRKHFNLIMHPDEHEYIKKTSEITAIPMTRLIINATMRDCEKRIEQVLEEKNQIS